MAPRASLRACWTAWTARWSGGTAIATGLAARHCRGPRPICADGRHDGRDHDHAATQRIGARPTRGMRAPEATVCASKPARSERTRRPARALSTWENEGSADCSPRPRSPIDRPGSGAAPKLKDAELVQLRIRVIALENLMVALLAEVPPRQLERVRAMAKPIAPRPGFPPHPMTISRGKGTAEPGGPRRAVSSQPASRTVSAPGGGKGPPPSQAGRYEPGLNAGGPARRCRRSRMTRGGINRHEAMGTMSRAEPPARPRDPAWRPGLPRRPPRRWRHRHRRHGPGRLRRSWRTDAAPEAALRDRRWR